MYLQKMQDLIDFLKGLPPEALEMDAFIANPTQEPECGSAGCIVGNLAMAKLYGFALQNSSSKNTFMEVTTPLSTSLVSDYADDRIPEHFANEFGISQELANQIIYRTGFYDPDLRSLEQISAQQVINRLEDLLAEHTALELGEMAETC